MKSEPQRNLLIDADSGTRGPTVDQVISGPMVTEGVFIHADHQSHHAPAGSVSAPGLVVKVRDMGLVGRESMGARAPQSRIGLAAPVSSPPAPGMQAAPKDQAERLRALVEALSGAPRAKPQSQPAPASVPPPKAAAPAQTPAPQTPPAPPAVRRVPVLAISSGKGGVGKTTLAVNLSIAFQSLGVRTTLVDGDLALANADVLCGLNPARRLDRALLGSDQVPLSALATLAPGGFRLVPGSVGVARMADLSDRELDTLLSGLAALERDTDLVILDTGAGVNPSVLGFVAAADCTLVVATPEPTSIADAYALIKCRTLTESAPRPCAPGVTAPAMMLVANQVESEDEAIAIHRRVALVAQRFLSLGLPLAGWIAADPRVPESIRAREPLTLRSPKSAAARDIRTLAMTLAPRLGVKVTAQPSEPTSLVGRLFGRAR
ncbi:MAG: P-loop NTPase [Planctomycetota bacterium]|nr:P-loop NTPase [Planctomycetota bacterium]